MRVVADTSRCVGAGQCVLTDPAVFDQSDDDGTVVVRVASVEGEQLQNAEEAVDLCPAQALSIKSD